MQHSVSAILLAAGLSRRMGQPKQLLPLDGKPLIRWCIESILAAGIGDLVVVLGRHAAAIEGVIGDLPVSIAFNNDSASDMAESVRVGLQDIAHSSTGVLIALCDHPVVGDETIRMLIKCHKDNIAKIVIPVYQGRRGHPVIFPRIMIDGIFPRATLRDVIRNNSRDVLQLEVSDEGVVTDIDTIEDYRKLCGNRSDRDVPASTS